MALKYIITRYSPIVFSSSEKHSEVAKGLGDIESAGFLIITVDENKKMVCSVYGESISLKVKSHPDDKIKLERMLNNH